MPAAATGGRRAIAAPANATAAAAATAATLRRIEVGLCMGERIVAPEHEGFLSPDQACQALPVVETETTEAPDATAAAPGSVKPAVLVRGLYRAFGDRWALRGVDLELPRGATLAVIGPNGAGKSTLLRVLATLLRPTEGTVSVLGCELPDEAWRLRSRLGYLGHRPSLYADLTAAENLRFAAELFGLPDRGAVRSAALLEAVGLGHRAGTRVAEMSAGMVQRLAICRAVLHEPELLVLDEPLSHLDPGAGATVAPLLEGPGLTRVLVTHDVGAALADADRVLALRRDGAVAYAGPAAGLDEASARAVYADAPRSRS
jgi:ABC-type multidrug transport system ATPase subunit